MEEVHLCKQMTQTGKVWPHRLIFVHTPTGESEVVRQYLMGKWLIGYFLPGARGAFCHSTCDSKLGCWGPRREDCIRCRSHSIEDTTCVNSCTELPGYYDAPREDKSAEAFLSSLPSNPMTKRLQLARLAAGHVMDGSDPEKAANLKAPVTCARCHSECAVTCTGPGPDQCIGHCKHARVSLHVNFIYPILELWYFVCVSFKLGEECVSECPHNTFLDVRKGLCTPCNAKCHQRGLTKKPVCSGTGNYPGPGGCSKCEMFLEFISFDGLLKGSDDSAFINSFLKVWV